MTTSIMVPEPCQGPKAASAPKRRPSLKDLYWAWLKQQGRRGLSWRRWQTNRLFYTWLLLTCLVISVAAIWPVLRDLLFGYMRLDCATEFGLEAKKPFYDVSFFWECVTGMVLVAGHYVLCFGEGRRRWRRSCALAGALLYLVALVPVNDRLVAHQRVLGGLASGNAFELQWNNLQHLRIIECSALPMKGYEIRKELCRRDLKTFAEFHRGVMDQYARYAPKMKKEWPGADEQDERKLKTLFFMNFVSGLWSFGNKLEVEKPGGVFGNERNQGAVPPPSLHAYLAAKIGCCTDFAYLVKSLLDHEGIENRLTGIPGHIFNEVRLGGRWCIADATTNIFLETSWEELYNEQRPDYITALVFPNASASMEKLCRYRCRTGQFRLMTLLRAANHPEQLRETEHPSLPSYFD